MFFVVNISLHDFVGKKVGKNTKIELQQVVSEGNFPLFFVYLLKF